MMPAIQPIVTNALPKLVLLVLPWQVLSNVLAVGLASGLASVPAAEFEPVCQ